MSRLPFALIAALLALGMYCSPGYGEELDDILLEKCSFDLQINSLQECFDKITKSVQAKHPDFAIKIAAKDLQAEGITRNSLIRNKAFKDQPLGNILTALAVAGNPVTKLKSPSERNQKLIWIITQDPDDDGRRIVLFTTRAAAEKRGDTLPTVFQPLKPTPEK